MPEGSPILVEAPKGGLQLRDSALAPLRFPAFRLVFIATALGRAGNAMWNFALGWLVVQLALREAAPERAGVYLGLMGLAAAASSFVGIVGGVIADRIDRRLMLIATHVVTAAVCGGLAIAVITDRHSVPLVIAGTLLLSGLFSLETPARLALTTDSVPARHGFGALNVVRLVLQLATFVGPVLGGVLVAAFGVGGAMSATTVIIALALGAFLFVAPRPVGPESRTDRIVTALGRGLRFARSNAPVRALVVFTTVIAALQMSTVQLLPAFVHDALGGGAVELSWLISAYAAGSFIGAIAMVSLSHYQEVGRLVLGGAFAVAALLALLGAQQAVLPAVAANAALGCAHMIWAGTSTNLVQMRTPVELRGRVIGLYVMSVTVGTGVGAIVMGSFAAVAGISVVMVAAGAVALLATFWTARFVASIRDLTL